MKKLLAIVSWLLVVSVPVAGILAYTQRQEIEDWYRLRDYQPTSEVVQLASDTTMTDSARRLFYVYRPQVDGRDSFNTHCTHDEQTIVLGCYVSRQGIYLFEVDDKRLEGVKQVTAAHELLHAAYDRLSVQDRERIDTLTAEAFAAVTNERIKKTVENYRSRDPNIVPNELHSILATEVRRLPDELEEYYKQYFSSRQQVVAYSEKYESILTERRTRAATLESQITGLRGDIEQLEAVLSNAQTSLSRDRSGVDTQDEVQAFNQRVKAYNQQVGQLNGMIDRYNSLIEEYKKNAVEAQELYQAIDSRPTI